MKQGIKANLYLATDILALAAIIVLVFYTKKKDETFLIGSALLGVLAFIIIAIQAKWGQTKVSNKSSATIYAKPEEGTEPVGIVPQGEQWGIDGIKTDGKVYKLPDGVHATVAESGKIRIASLTGTFIYMLIGGRLSTPPDGGWQKLFDR